MSELYITRTVRKRIKEDRLDFSRPADYSIIGHTRVNYNKFTIPLSRQFRL
jgi:hypothetical protein